MVSTTRSTTWRSDHSRSGVPSVPRKYFWATMFVAFSDHDGQLDAELLEGDRAVLAVGDPGVAPFPRDFVVGMDPGRREVAADADTGALGCEGHSESPLLDRTGAGPVLLPWLHLFRLPPRRRWNDRSEQRNHN